MAATPMPFVKARFFDRCGKPLSGGKVYTYEPRSTTPKVTYTSGNGDTPNTNPITLDAAGQANIYLRGRYRFITQDSKGVVVEDGEDIGSWYSDSLDDQLESINDYLVLSGQQVVDVALAGLALDNGWLDSLVSTNLDGNISQFDLNRKTLVQITDYAGFNALSAIASRPVIVTKTGIAGTFVYAPLNPSSHDGGTIIVDSQLRKWARQFDGAALASWFDLVGDGATDESAKFALIDAAADIVTLDGQGKTFKVNTYPNAKKYTNAQFKVGAVTYDANFKFVGRTLNNNVLIGKSAGLLLPTAPTTDRGDFNIVVGNNAMPVTAETRSSIAIGTDAMSKSTSGRYNIGIGGGALNYVMRDTSTYGGTRNVALGDLTLHFLTTGYQNVALGRNAGQGVTSARGIVAIGANAMSGFGSLKYSDANLEIENQTPISGDANRNVMIGDSAGFFGVGFFSTGVGGLALNNAKCTGNFTRNTAVGATASEKIGITTSIRDKVLTAVGRSGSYIMTASGLITFTLSAHGCTDGGEVVVAFTTGLTYSDSQYYIATVINANTFTVNDPKAVDAVGTFTLISSATLAKQATSINNTSVGCGAMRDVEYGNDNTVVGMEAMRANTGGTQNTSVGSTTMSFAVNSSQNTALGCNALRTMVDGSNATSLQNSTGLGCNARVSGSNQIQLGAGDTTVYAFGAIQDRSDERDKADVRDTVHGLDFILALRPVDFKWDMRDDYVQIDPETSEVIKLTKDGSKTRSRYHHGFIAQEVESLITEQGNDFGGYQDHSKLGGSDVKSLGYVEFIAPLVKAVQQQQAQIEDLKAQIEALS